MLKVTGILLLVLSLASAAALLLSPFDIPVPKPAVAAWILFPVLLAAGFVLAALGSTPAGVGTLFRVIGTVLLVLACAAALGLVAAGVGLVTLQGPSVPLWYMLVAGLVLGTAGLTARGQTGKR